MKHCLFSYVASVALLTGTMPAPLRAQAPSALPSMTRAPAGTPSVAGPEKFNTEQFVALIALYQDTLLTQLLMATTNPIEIVAASRWLAQRPNAPGGARGYMHNVQMTGGFTFLAWPADYGSSGIVTFIVGPNGVTHPEDHGPGTLRTAAAIPRFDPDLSGARIDIAE